ncbi:MAG: transposase [Streptosporangiaceae bacterium]
MGADRTHPVRLAAIARRRRAGLSPPTHELREIVNAILYVNRTGMAWEYLPHDFLPYKTVLTSTPGGKPWP